YHKLELSRRPCRFSRPAGLRKGRWPCRGIPAFVRPSARSVPPTRGGRPICRGAAPVTALVPVLDLAGLRHALPSRPRDRAEGAARPTLLALSACTRSAC